MYGSLFRNFVYVRLCSSICITRGKTNKYCIYYLFSGNIFSETRTLVIHTNGFIDPTEPATVRIRTHAERHANKYINKWHETINNNHFCMWF